LEFRFYPLRFRLVARDPIRFSPGMPGNTLRGAFGMTLRRLICRPECPGARACPEKAECPYARWFEPSAAGPSGLRDRPRPVVFRAGHLDGVTLEPGEPFFFDLNLFDIQRPSVQALSITFSEMAAAGFGPGRGRATLIETSQRNAHGEWIAAGGPPLSLCLEPDEQRVERLRVQFVTPTELKTDGGLAGRPDFAPLACRIRDRIAALAEFYGDGPLALDFRDFGERSKLVCMTRCEVRRVEATRRSSRTGQEHPLGGFVGEAEYEGELSPFAPFLRAARWTGVGRQTVWGKGQIEVEG
jgi:hypothetical protein